MNGYLRVYIPICTFRMILSCFFFSLPDIPLLQSVGFSQNDTSRSLSFVIAYRFGAFDRIVVQTLVILSFVLRVLTV